MTQPLDRTAKLPAIGEVDREAGEFWVDNPFLMPEMGENLSAYERNCLFLNTQDESFLDVSFASAVDLDSDSRSVIPADFNRDGKIDLLVCSVGGGPLRMFSNRLPQQGASVRVQLTGAASNRPAIGSRVVLRSGAQVIVRDNFAANGFMGQAPAELVIGVGAAKRIDQMEVRWPSGKVQTFGDLPTNASLSVVEGQETVTTRPYPSKIR